MKRRLALAVFGAAVGSALCSALVGAQAARPRTYSYTEIGTPFYPDQTLKVYRDGDHEVIETTFPVSTLRPLGYHDRRFYDFQAKKLYTLVLDDPSNPPCGVQALTADDIDNVMDVVTGYKEVRGQVSSMKPKAVANDTVNGVATKVFEGVDPTGQISAKLWQADQGETMIKLIITQKGQAPRTMLEVKDLRFEKPPASVMALSPACSDDARARAAASGGTPVPPSAPPLATAASKAAAAGSSAGLPAGLTAPAGFVVDEKASKTYDFNHEPMGYQKGSSMEHIDPEGRTWSIFMRVVPPNKTADTTDAALRASLKAQGWEVLTASGTVVARRTDGARLTWLKAAAFSGEVRAVAIEVGPPPHSLTLLPPAATPETVADTADFPYLLKFPGSTLKRTGRSEQGFNVAPPGSPEQLAGPPVQKFYDLPPTISTYEYMVVYRDALTKAGWTIARAAAGSDALVVAHYAKNGRDIFCYLHDGTFSVVDVGAANEAKALADALARDGHVAIYGIYFDVDKSTLRPDSETALQHVLALLKSDAKLTLEVQGHTDNSGTPAHNLTLSDDRSVSVKTWLVEHGIAAARLTPKGYGDTQPVGDNKTPDGRAKNRRVELKRS